MKPSLHLTRPVEPLPVPPSAESLAGYLPTCEYYRLVFPLELATEKDELTR